MRRLLPVALVLLSTAALAAEAPAPGLYKCFAYTGSPPRPLFVGAMTLDANGGYAVETQNVRGSYRVDAASGLVTFVGQPPLGFAAGVAETDPSSRRRQLRLYPAATDVGDKWKAAICSAAQPR